METYGYIAKEVAPKKQRLKAAQDNLAKQEAALQDARCHFLQSLPIYVCNVHPVLSWDSFSIAIDLCGEQEQIGRGQTEGSHTQGEI